MNQTEPSHHGPADDSTRSYPNETMRLLLERSSCRSFEDMPIPPDVLELVLKAGLRSATGGNLQPYSIIQIENTKTKEHLARLCHQPFIGTAAVDLIICLDWRRLMRWAELERAPFAANNSFRHFWISFEDASIAAQNICTAADAMGLGSVYVGTIQEFIEEVCELCDLPQSVFPIVLLCLGYPKQRPLPRKKLGLNMIVHKEKYRDAADRELLDAFNEKYSEMKIKITAERLEQFETVCRKLHGDEFTREAVAKVTGQGYFSAVQRYFGLHYVADLMAEGNERFLELMEQRGFGWFREFTPAGDV